MNLREPLNRHVCKPQRGARQKNKKTKTLCVKGTPNSVPACLYILYSHKSFQKKWKRRVPCAGKAYALRDPCQLRNPSPPLSLTKPSTAPCPQASGRFLHELTARNLRPGVAPMIPGQKEGSALLERPKKQANFESATQV